MSALTVIEDVLGAWRRGDVEAAVAAFTPDGVFREARREPVRGHEALRAHFTRFLGSGRAWRIAVHDVLAAGETLAVIYTFFIEGAAAKWSERDGTAVVRLRDGFIREWREYEG